MKKKFSYVVIEDGLPICVADDFKYIREYLDNYCGVSNGQAQFIDYEPDNSKYPGDYQGRFIYKEFWVPQSLLYFKVYISDVALPTKEQKRDDNIDEILNS
jgi:hypothetical protein